MTRKLQNPTLEDGRSRKRALKPVVEKKRRDRINQSLVELRRLLSKHTSDARLQNPKLEKAEILDLTVEYLQKWTEGGNLSNGVPDSGNSETKTHSSVADPSESKAPYLFTLESAGFRECVAKMTNYMHRITPTQRASLIMGLKHHTENLQTNSTEADLSQGETETTRGSDETSLDSVYTSKRREDCTKLLFSSYSPFQPLSCSTPCHDHLSPPPSPWLPSSLSTYAPSPSFPSFASHFSSPPILSPLSSNTSFFSFSPTVPHPSSPAIHCPPFVTLRTPPQPVQREGSLPNPVTPIWRPWF